MAQNIAPKADQPRVTTQSLQRLEKPNAVQYRVQNVQSLNRSPSNRSYGRSMKK